MALTFGIRFELPAGEVFDPAHLPYADGDILDVPYAWGVEPAVVRSVEVEDDGSAIYVSLEPA